MAKMFSGVKPTATTHQTVVTIDPPGAYLSSPPLPQITDPLAYWNAKLTSDTEAQLAQMAIDFLLTVLYANVCYDHMLCQSMILWLDAI